MCVTPCSVSSYCTLVINLKWRRREKKRLWLLSFLSLVLQTRTILASLQLLDLLLPLCRVPLHHISELYVYHLYPTYSAVLWTGGLKTKLDTSWMWFTSLFCLWLAGLRSSGRHARPPRPHQLHAPTAASPPLHVPLSVSVPHPAAGLQPIPSRHRWSEVSASRLASSVDILQSENPSNPKPWWIVNSKSYGDLMKWSE